MLAYGHDRRLECRFGQIERWEQWSVDLSAYAGQQVEVSIAYVSDWATQGLGVFIDDTAVSTGASTSFESRPGWLGVTGPPPEALRTANNFIRTTAAGFPEGATITTDDTIYFGFGFEGISSPRSKEYRYEPGDGVSAPLSCILYMLGRSNKDLTDNYVLDAIVWL